MSELVNQQQAAVALAGGTSAPERDHHHHPHGNPHLAHHFDTPEQQYNSAKVGMWVFLATELLMFGGLFCAYSVYRHNHPEVFDFAHQALDKSLGAINTVILISSSFTMALGVRMAQLGKRVGLVTCLALTLLGGAGFMVIKTIEYHAKYEHHLWFGAGNQYSKLYNGPKVSHDAGHGQPAGPAMTEQAAPAQGVQPGVHVGPESGQHANAPNLSDTRKKIEAEQQSHVEPAAPGMTETVGAFHDPNAGTGDEAKIKPTLTIPGGLTRAELEPHAVERSGHTVAHVTYDELPQSEKDRVATFFNIYFLMTGLHGVHVVVGMALIAWVLVRGYKNEFGPSYYTPVDLVGLYWHLVDLIWIFLFPLLYLIH